jgi:CPA2 family monovalent cation:H+ antiporter-2
MDAYELIDHKVDNIYRETLYSAVNMGIDILVELGHRKYTANRHGQKFIKHDEITTRKLAKKRSNKTAFVATTKEEVKLQEQLLKIDIHSQVSARNHSWDSKYLNKKMAK